MTLDKEKDEDEFEDILEDVKLLEDALEPLYVTSR